MAQVVGPVNSTANYADNVLEGVWSSGFLFAQAQPILIEVTYGVALGASNDIIHDLICPAAQSVNIIAPTSPHYSNITINRVRFKSQGSQPATVSGYFNEARAPGIIAGVSGGPLGGQALLQLSGFSVADGSTLLVGLPTFLLPVQFGGFWLGSTGQTNSIEVLVQTQSGTTPIGGIVSGDIYGFSAGNAGQYAVPSLGATVTLTVRSNGAQNINLTAVPILAWPPPQFDPPQANTLVLNASGSIAGGGIDIYVLPPYDGDATLVFNNSSANVMNLFFYQTDFRGNVIGNFYRQNSLAAAANINTPIKLPHRINQFQVQGTPGGTYYLSIIATPRRGGS